MQDKLQRGTGTYLDLGNKVVHEIPIEGAEIFIEHRQCDESDEMLAKELFLKQETIRNG